MSVGCAPVWSQYNARSKFRLTVAGLVFGFAGLVDYIVKKIRREMKRPDMPVIATGGFSEIIAKEISCIGVVDKLLTLQRLKYLYDLNAEGKK